LEREDAALTAAVRVPPGLARVRKEIPPPGKIFRDKKKISRKRAKAELRDEWKESLPPNSS
jgi:hypothetical protein